MEHDELSTNLLKRYKEIFSQSDLPDWAVENKANGGIVTPSIPFVGDSYNKCRNKVLIYASAENLTYYEYGESSNSLLESELSWNRRRYSLGINRDKFFPDIHIAPINNGGLISTVAFICHKYGLLDVQEDPYNFIESLAVDNICKYSIKTTDKASTKNIDYIKNTGKMNSSLQYIESDLKILKPDYIFMPVSAYDVSEIQKIIKKILPSATVVPMYQLTSTVVNCHISPNFSRDEIKNIKKMTPRKIQDWIDKIVLNGLKKDGMYIYFSDVLERAERVLSIQQDQ